MTEDNNAVDFIDTENSINDTLENYHGRELDICDMLYHSLIKCEKQSQYKAFKYVCEQYGHRAGNESNEARKSSLRDQIDQITMQYGAYVNSLLEVYLNMNPAEDDLYRRLWNSIQNDTVLDDDQKRCFAFYYIIIDRRIPYFHIDTSDLVTMSDDKFASLNEKYNSGTRKIRFILTKPFEQKTEQASVLLNEFGISGDKYSDDKDTYEKYIIYMSVICDELKRADERYNHLLDELG